MGKDEEANQREEETDFFHLESRDGYLQRIDQPFLPNVEYRLNANNDVVGYDVTFNQAYIFNRVSSGQVQVKDERKISNMEEAHELEREHDIKYYVQVEIDPQNFKITDAQFTGYTPDCEEQTNFPHILFDQFDDDQQPFTGWFPVLRLEDGQVTDFTQRNNIFLSDRQFKQVGNSTTGEVGAAHILVESGRKTDDLPVRVRSISGAGIIEVTEFPDYILLSGEASGSSGDWSGENKGLGAQIYDEYTLNPAEFRTLTGAENIVITQGVNEIEIKSEDQICGSASDADWWAYVEDSKQPAKFRGLKAGSGVHFNADDDGCVTTIDVDTGCCTGMSGISVTTIYNTYNSNTNITYSSSDTSTIEFYGNGKELLKLDGDSEVVTIGSDQSGECVTAKIYGDYELLDCADGTKLSDSKKDSDGDGVSSTYDRDGNPSTEMGSNSSKEGSIKTYNAAGTQIINETSSDGAGNAVSKQRNSSNQVVNQTAASASTDTFFNAGGVAIGDNSTVAGKSLYVKGTTRIQDSSTAGDGTLEFGNDSTHSIGYATSKNALTVGAGVKRFDADHGEQIDLYSTNAASYSAQDGYIAASSPATGSAILAGSGNSISGHYNVITAGANNTISGKSMNFIGGGSGIDITDSEFSVSVGGRNNDISGANWSVIAGGYDNLISGKNTNSIGGGYSNEIRGVFASVIAGGYDNLVSGNLESAGAVVGGVNNKVEKSHYGFIGAGASNTIKEDSDGAVIVGGLGNTLNGTNSFIGGGQENAVSGTYGVALGSFAKVKHNGAFVFSDGTPATAFSSGDNTLLMSFKSGVYVQSNSGLYVNGNPVMTGASDLDTDTLQTVTTRGNTTTNNIKVNTFSGAFGFVDVGMCIGPAGSPKAAPAYGLDCEESAFLGGTAIISGNVAGRNTLEVSGDAGGTGFGGRLTLGGTGYLLSGDVAGTESDTLQTVTDRGATTTNDVTVADLLVQNDGQVRANGAGSLTLGNTNGGTIYVSGTSAKSIITPRVNHLYLQSNRDEDDILFYAGEADVEMARFDSANQRFGIGTASPVSRLHIGNATGSTLGLRFTNPTETVNQYFADDSTDSDFFITYAGNGGAEITLQHDGKLALNASNGDNVGVGTDNPSEKLTVDGNIRINGNSREFYFAGNQAQIRASSASTDITFVNSSTELVRFASDGKVGIGTNDPSAQLTVSGDGIRIISTGTNANNGEARIGVAGNNSRPNFELGPQGNSDEFQIINGGDWKVRTTTTTDLAFGTNSTNAIYIEGTNQNVGIGTTTPRTTLHVSKAGATEGGILTIDNPNNTDGAYCGIEFINSTVGYPRSAIFAMRTGGYDAELTFHTSPTNEITGTDYPAATERMRIDHDGRVGIGSNSPAYVLDTVFAGDNGARLRSTDNHASLYIQSAAGYGGYIRFTDGPSRYWINATSDDKLRFRPNATSLESATINFDATGNVGIGVLSPSQKLEVGTNTDVSAQIGVAHVGYMGFADHAGFAHLDNASTSNYSLLQSSAGDTFINSAASRHIYFRDGNATIGGFNGNDDFYVDTDTLYVDASEDRVGINDTTPSYPLDVNGIIRTQGGLLGTQFGTGPCTTIDGFFASTSTEDYGFQNALLMNDLAGFTKWAGVTIATSGLYKTRGGSAGSYTYSNEAGTGDFDRAFQANNNTVGSWYTDSGPDGDITTGVGSTGVVELYFNGVKSLNYSAQAAIIFGSNPFRATHVKIEALRTGAWQTILDTTENDKTALIARIAGNGGGANATTGLRYSFARAGNYFRINNLYAADYDLGNDLSYGGQYYIDKYYDGRHYSTLYPVIDGGSDLGTSSNRYGGSYVDYGRFTNAVGIGTDTLTYGLNVSNSDEVLAYFKSSDNKAGILIQDNDTAAYVSVENNILSLGPQNGTNAAQNLNYNVTNYRLGIGTNVPDLPLHVKGTGIRLEESGAARHLDILPASAGINHKFIGDNTSAGYEFHNNGGLLASFGNVNNYFANNVGIGSATPAFELDVVGTIHGTSGNFENGITIDGNPVVTGTSAFESDTLQTVTDQGNITTNNIIIENNGNDPEYGALTISGGYALAHLRSTGTVAYLQFQNSTTSYGTMSNVGMTIGNNGHDAYVSNRQALGNLYLATSGEARVTIKPDGKVGIGTLTPVSALHVIGDGGDAVQVDNGYLRLRTTATNQALQLNSSVSNEARIAAGIFDLSQAHPLKIGGDYVRFCTSGAAADTEVMRMTAEGNVGIGTSDPDTKLHLQSGRLTIAGNGSEAIKVTNSDIVNFDLSTVRADLFRASAISDQLEFRGGSNRTRFLNSDGGTELFTITDAGKVGIGTTGPNQLLHVDGKTQLGTNGFSEGGLLINYASLSETKGGAATLLGNAVYAGTTNNTFRRTKGDAGNYILMTYNRGIAFHTNVTGNTSDDYSIDNHEQMRITTGGSVGIGTTDPTAQYDKTIHIEGTNPTFRAETNYSAGWAYSQYVSPETTWSVGIDNNDKYIIANSATLSSNVKFVIDDANGFVGIGSTSPQTILDVDGSSNHGIRIGSNNALIGEGGSTGTQLIFWNGTSAYYGRSAAPFNHTVSNHFFRVGGNDIAMIGSAGVGIGTTSPARKLEVSESSSSIVSQFKSTAGTSAFISVANTTATADQIRFGSIGNDLVLSTNYTERFRIDSAGNVGIGISSPSYELDVNGTTRSTYYVGGAYLEENASSSKLKFYTDGTVLVMDEDGELKPCEKENDTLVFGVSKRDFDSPVVLGAEPILVTGPIKVGDYIVTSSKQGHGQAMKEQNIGTIIAQAMESGDGESYNIKAMIRKM